jgi:hypothetical protein
MANVGDFTPTETTDPDAAPDTFTYFGTEFEVPATVGAGALLRFAWLMKGAVAQSTRGEQAKRRALTDEGRARARVDIIEADLSASSAIYELLTACLGAGQMEQFLAVADANGVTQDALMEVCDRIQGVIGDRPTRRSADSSDGPQTSGQPSTDAGSGPTEIPEDMTARDIQAAQIEAASISLADLPG